jgi:HSP20 family molecular chaperone IbpA
MFFYQGYPTVPLYPMPSMFFYYPIPPAGAPTMSWFQSMPSSSAFAGGASYNVITDETPTGYVVNLFLKGVDPREIDMKAQGNTLVFERTATSGTSGTGSYSFGFGSFHWTVPLPANADLSRMNGRVQPEGIQIFIPKAGR